MRVLVQVKPPATRRSPATPGTSGRGRPWRAVGIGLALVLSVLAITTDIAAAHATLAGADPANGSTVPRVPERIELRVTGKAATTEGEPVRVFDPSGRRVDTGHVHIPDTGDVIHADLDPTSAAPGEYQVLYEIVSADTHVISGRLSFTVHHDGAQDGGAEQRSRSFSAGAGSDAIPADAATSARASADGGEVARGYVAAGETSVHGQPTSSGLARGGPTAVPVAVLASCIAVALFPAWSRRRRRRQNMKAER